MVSDLLMNEELVDQKPNKKSLSKSDDSGLDSGQSSFNTGSHFSNVTFNLPYFQAVNLFPRALGKIE